MTSRLTRAVTVFPTPGVWTAIWCVVGAAIYGCVPETDQMPAIGIVTAGALATEVATRRRLPWLMHMTIVTMLLWSGMYGNSGRQSATAGALFAFWPAFIVPLTALVYPPITTRPEWVRVVIAGFGGVAALVVSRTGAVQPILEPAIRAIVVCGVSSIIATGVMLAATRKSRQPS